MSEWISVDSGKPRQGERVLLAIRYEDCPVVGYWGESRWEACCVNHEVSCGEYCYGGMVDGNFETEEVTHWMPIEDVPGA